MSSFIVAWLFSPEFGQGLQLDDLLIMAMMIVHDSLLLRFFAPIWAGSSSSCVIRAGGSTVPLWSFSAKPVSAGLCATDLTQNGQNIVLVKLYQMAKLNKMLKLYQKVKLNQLV